MVSEIQKLVKKYIEFGYDVVLVFLGDVIHDSIKDPDQHTFWNNILIDLIESCNGALAVVGNHETTYGKNNPFWHLVSEIRSPRLNSLWKNKSWGPKGVKNYFNIVDEFAIGNVRFHMNHHSTGIQKPLDPRMINIGLFHQDIHSDIMISDAKAVFGVNVHKHSSVMIDTKVPVLSGYNYVFIGHAHWNYGTWKFVHPFTGEECIIYNLASLGRTNPGEVVDTFLERNIPAVVMENDKFVGIQNNLIKLGDRKSTVNEVQLKVNQMAYEITKDRKAMRESVRFNSDPIKNIEEVLMAHDDPNLIMLFKLSVNQKLTSVREAVLRGEKLFE